MLIYYVEDEKDFADLLKKYLELEQYEVRVFHTGEEVMKHIKDEDVALWILDINLGGKIDGFDLIDAIREHDENIPVLFTSARDSDLDKIAGLEKGSDDYLSKPFSPKEFILRVNGLLNRKSRQRDEIVEISFYTINITKRVVKDGDDKEIELTYKEFQLLEYFLKRKGEEISRDELIKNIWGKDYKQTSRVVDDLLRRLRQKMPKIKIETIYGLGYRLI